MKAGPAISKSGSVTQNFILPDHRFVTCGTLARWQIKSGSGRSVRAVRKSVLDCGCKAQRHAALVRSERWRFFQVFRPCESGVAAALCHRSPKKSWPLVLLSDFFNIAEKYEVSMSH